MPRQLTKSARTLERERKAEEKRIAELKWQKEQAEEARRYSFILNHVSTKSNRCAICNTHIDEGPKIPGSRTPEGTHRPRSYSNTNSINSLRLMSMLCYQCFLDNGTGEAVVKTVARRLQFGPLKKKRKLRSRSLERKRDLLVLLALAVQFRYGLGFSNYEVSSATRGMKHTAMMWQASAVYRRMRKRFRIKGMVCKVMQHPDDDRLSMLFMGGEVAGAIRRLISEIRNPYCHSGVPYMWERNIAETMVHDKGWNPFLLSINLPLDVRLKHFKTRYKSMKEMVERHRQEVSTFIRPDLIA